MSIAGAPLTSVEMSHVWVEANIGGTWYAFDPSLKTNTKIAAKYAEQARVSVRNVRRDVMNDLKDMVKEKMVSQDDDRRAQDEIQKLTDRYVKQIDEVLVHKEKEIKTV